MLKNFMLGGSSLLLFVLAFMFAQSAPYGWFFWVLMVACVIGSCLTMRKLFRSLDT